MTTDKKNVFTEDDFDGDIDFEELEEEYSEDNEYSETEAGFSDEEEEQTDALEDSAFSPEYDEEAETEEEAEADDTDEPDSGEDEENDTVAMVFRNSERVQHNKAVDYSDLPVKEAQIEIPVREVRKTPPVQNIRQENNGKSSGNNIKINKFCVVNTIISAFTLCAVATGIFAGYGYLKSLEEDISLKDERIRELEKTNEELLGDYVEASAVKETEKVHEEEREIDIEKGKILLWDSILGYTWTPVLAGLPLNNYVQDNFSLNNRGHMSYTVNGDTCSYFGIDVSSYQGDINWQLVREDGVEFAFLRLGFRGYGEEGNIRLDDKFEANYEGAHNAGLDVGVYFYSQAISVEEAIEEAHFVLDKLNGRPLEYPIVFDWETVYTGSDEDIPRTEDVMPHTLTLSAIAFCETIQDAGYEAMIYTNKRQAVLKYDMRQLANYPVWLAQYNTTLSYIYDFDIWQYGVGTVDGIEGEVDLNIAMIK